MQSPLRPMIWFRRASSRLPTLPSFTVQSGLGFRFHTKLSRVCPIPGSLTTYQTLCSIRQVPSITLSLATTLGWIWPLLLTDTAKKVLDATRDGVGSFRGSRPRWVRLIGTTAKQLPALPATGSPRQIIMWVRGGRQALGLVGSEQRYGMQPIGRVPRLGQLTASI